MTTMTRKRVRLAATALAAIVYSQSAFATASVPCATGPTPSNVMSCATGLSVDLSVLNLVTVGVGPVANAFGTAPQPYDITQSVISFNSTSNLILGSLGLTTGIITDTASSSYTGDVATLSSTATSTVNNLAFSLGIPSLFGTVSLLDISAKTLSSTSSAAKTNGGLLLVTSGSSEIEDLTISALGLSAVTLNANALASAPVNDYLVSLLGLDVIANYQTPIYLNSDVIGIQTAALAIKFDDFAFGGGLLNGTILVADSAASVPEPATWAMMLVGFGLAGAAIRGRRQLPRSGPAYA